MEYVNLLTAVVLGWWAYEVGSNKSPINTGESIIYRVGFAALLALIALSAAAEFFTA